MLPTGLVIEFLGLYRRQVVALERIADAMAPAATATKFCGVPGIACLAGCTANKGGRCARAAALQQRQPRGRA